MDLQIKLFQDLRNQRPRPEEADCGCSSRLGRYSQVGKGRDKTKNLVRFFFKSLVISILLRSRSIAEFWNGSYRVRWLSFSKGNLSSIPISIRIQNWSVREGIFNFKKNSLMMSLYCVDAGLRIPDHSFIREVCRKVEGNFLYWSVFL